MNREDRNLTGNPAVDPAGVCRSRKLRMRWAPIWAIVVGVLAIPCMAQSNVTVTFSGGVTCNKYSQSSFPVLSVSTNITFPDPAFTRAPINFNDIAFTKNIDECSVSMYNFLFSGTRVPSVVISFYHTVNGLTKESLRITLTNCLLTSISHTETANVPTEYVTLSYQLIHIFDPLSGATKGYNRLTGLPE